MKRTTSIYQMQLRSATEERGVVHKQGRAMLETVIAMDALFSAAAENRAWQSGAGHHSREQRLSA
jgi:hypothetical protein